MTDRVIFNDAGNHWTFTRSQKMVSVPNADPSLMPSYLFSVNQDSSSNPRAYRGFIAGTPWTEFAAGTTSHFSPARMAIWYDRWTSGDILGDDVHIVWTHSGSGIGLYYNKFDTLTNSVALNHVAINTSLPYDPVSNTQLEIIKNENGDLWIAIWQDGASGSFFQLHRSTDDGVNWDVEFTSGPTQNMMLANVNFDSLNQFILVNAPGVPDANTPYIILADTSDAVSARQSIILASFNGTTLVERVVIDNDVENDDGHLYVGVTAAMRFSDRHIFVVYMSDEHNDAANELRMAEINLPNSITPHFDILTVADLGGDALQNPQLTIDQVRGHLYVGYLRGSGFLGPNMSVYWNKSINGGLQWIGEVLSTDGGDRDFRSIGMPRSVGDLDEVGQIFLAGYDDDSNDWLVSDDDLIIIGAYTVRATADGGPEQEVVECQTGNPPAGGCISRCPPPFFGTTDPQYATIGEQAFISYSGKGPGTFTSGDLVIGLRSGATGVFAAKRLSLQRALITDIKNGPRGQPFLPNERLQVVGDPNVWITLHRIVATDKFLRHADTVPEIA